MGPSLYVSRGCCADRWAGDRAVLGLAAGAVFVFVLVPEFLPIAETRKGIDHLAQYDLHVGTLVINKILPDSVSDPFFQGRLEQQRQYRARIDAEFPKQAKLDLPLLSHDIDTFESLQTIAGRIEAALVSEHN